VIDAAEVCFTVRLVSHQAVIYVFLSAKARTHRLSRSEGFSASVLESDSGGLVIKTASACATRRRMAYALTIVVSSW